MKFKEYNENGTKLYLNVADEDNASIEQYSISKGTGLHIGVQVSGEIQGFDQVEIGLYTSDNFPLCGFGPFVMTRISVSKFIISNGLVSIGIYHPQHQSKFAHVSFWTENNVDKAVELELKETLNFWENHSPNTEKIELKLMLTGYSADNNKTFMRDIRVVDLVR